MKTVVRVRRQPFRIDAYKNEIRPVQANGLEDGIHMDVILASDYQKHERGLIVFFPVGIALAEDIAQTLAS
jgi:hypothetical protein